VESSCEFSIEPSHSINCWETIEYPNRDLSSSMELVIHLKVYPRHTIRFDQHGQNDVFKIAFS
jgi:hypothetical protein